MNKMARIYGTNNREFLEERNFPYCQIKVWKGSKKQQRGDKKTFGKDLETKFRLEFSDNKFVTRILKEAYQAEETEGGLIVDRLNIILYCDDPEKAYYSALGIYKNNKPVHFCDKKTIHTKFIGGAEGNRRAGRGRPVKTNEPCKAKNIYEPCPMGCKEFGDLYFEILELRQAEVTRYCKIHVTGITDVITLGDAIAKTEKTVGAIRTSPFYSGQTQRFVVHQLTRDFDRKNCPIV